MLFKVTNEAGQSAHGVDVTHADNLPVGNEAGPWMPEIEGAPVYQQHGYHCGDESQILEWLGPAIYVVEHEGEMLVVQRSKVARRIRLTANALPGPIRRPGSLRSNRSVSCRCSRQSPRAPRREMRSKKPRPLLPTFSRRWGRSTPRRWTR